MADSVCVRSRKSTMWPTCVVRPDSAVLSRLVIHTSCSGLANGNGRRSSVLTTVKTVELAPIPRPAIRMTKIAKPASRRRERNV